LVMSTAVDYEQELLVGKGAMGEVHLALHRPTGRKVALKRIPRARNDAYVERRMLELVHAHPYVVSLEDVFESDSHIFLALQFANSGDLLQLVQAKTKVCSQPEREFQRVPGRERVPEREREREFQRERTFPASSAVCFRVSPPFVSTAFLVYTRVYAHVCVCVCVCAQA
jgi:Protein kinase domain